MDETKKLIDSYLHAYAKLELPQQNKKVSRFNIENSDRAL